MNQRPDLTLETKLRNLQEFSMRDDFVTRWDKQKKKRKKIKAKPAWGDVPYHFYIDSAGRIGEGRSMEFAGDTNTGYDTDGYIQIVVEGDFAQEQPGTQQLYALDDLVLWLADTYQMTPDDITGHADHAETDCPGANLQSHFALLRAKVGAR
jgi:N-acetyl-anhydromuramyl-L-alanine amidase AmpD